MIKVVLIGPESSGKTVLSEYLAEHFQTSFNPEYLRTYFEEKKAILEENMLFIAQKQQKNEENCSKKTQNLIFFDTNIITLKVYHELYFKTEPTWFNHLFNASSYDHYLLLKPDIPWVDDGQRDMPKRRQEIFDLFERELKKLDASYTIINGSFEDRKAQAVEKVKELLDAGE